MGVGKTLLESGIDIHGSLFDHFLANPTAEVITGQTTDLGVFAPAVGVDLGKRTLFLLRFFSSAEVRRVIRAETTKIEAYYDFLDWVSFGGAVIKSGDPVEQEKQLRYASLVVKTIMLSSVADLTSVLSGMAADGHPGIPGLVASLSLHIRGHILRFGQYALGMSDLPAPLDPQPLPVEPTL